MYGAEMTAQRVRNWLATVGTQSSHQQAQFCGLEFSVLGDDRAERAIAEEFLRQGARSPHVSVGDPTG
jgi:hypothetical protein